jgi:Reverse transcriptase (RNA-dependent DNA polymerase)
MAIEARRRNPETGLGWSLPLPVWPGTGKWAEFRERERSLTAAGESDHLIVLRDGRADHTGKGVTVVCSPQRPLAPDTVGPGLDEPTFLRAIATKAGHNKAHRFQNLYGHLDVPLLRQAWRSLNKRGAPGVDKVTIAQYGENLDDNLRRLVEKLKRNEYRSRLIRRKYRPKGNGKERPLGIPVVEDRLLQAAAKRLLEAMYEQDFLPTSYGYRPGVGAGKAVADLTYELQFGRHGYVVEADIKGFFDHLDHDWRLRMLELRVDDKPFLGLIASWLKAGILERDGTILHPYSGTPQGGGRLTDPRQHLPASRARAVVRKAGQAQHRRSSLPHPVRRRLRVRVSVPPRGNTLLPGTAQATGRIRPQSRRGQDPGTPVQSIPARPCNTLHFSRLRILLGGRQQRHPQGVAANQPQEAQRQPQGV